MSNEKHYKTVSPKAQGFICEVKLHIVNSVPNFFKIFKLRWIFF